MENPIGSEEGSKQKKAPTRKLSSARISTIVGITGVLGLTVAVLLPNLFLKKDASNNDIAVLRKQLEDLRFIEMEKLQKQVDIGKSMFEDIRYKGAPYSYMCYMTFSEMKDEANISAFSAGRGVYYICLDMANVPDYIRLLDRAAEIRNELLKNKRQASLRGTKQELEAINEVAIGLISELEGIQTKVNGICNDGRRSILWSEAKKDLVELGF